MLTVDSPQPDTIREIVTMLRDVTGEDDRWADRITADTRLEDDLWLESVELAALDLRLRQRYGAGVDLLGFLATRDLDEIIALRVGDLANLVADR